MFQPNLNGFCEGAPPLGQKPVWWGHCDLDISPPTSTYSSLESEWTIETYSVFLWYWVQEGETSPRQPNDIIPLDHETFIPHVNKDGFCEEMAMLKY